MRNFRKFMFKGVSIAIVLCMLVSLIPAKAYAGLFDDLFNEYNIGGKQDGTKNNSYLYNVIWRVTPDKSLTLAGNATYRRSNYGESGMYIYTAGPLFYVPDGCTLIIKDNVVVTSSTNPGTAQPLIEVDSGGKLIMEGNARLSDAVTSEAPAVILRSGATFEMKGGTITNTYGAVRVESGATFTMTGGIIKDTIGYYDTAVSVKGGTFSMNNATIDNCSSTFGGGIALSSGANFSISNSTISNCRSSLGGAIFINSGVPYPDFSTVTFANNVSEHGDQPECQNVYAVGRNTAYVQTPSVNFYMHFDYERETVSPSPVISLQDLEGNAITSGMSITPYIGQLIKYKLGGDPYYHQYRVPYRPDTSDVQFDITQRRVTIPAGYRYNTQSSSLSDSRWVMTSAVTVVPLPTDDTKPLYVYKAATAGSWRSEVVSYSSAVNISFDTQGAGESADKTAYYGREYGELPVLTREGYSFAGWYASATGGTAVTAGTIVSNETDHTLYARWIANTYTIKFDSNGGNGGEMADITARYGDLVKLTANAFTHSTASMKFVMWATKSDGTGDTANDASQVMNLTSEQNGTITLYAVWADIRIENNQYLIGTKEQLIYFRNLVNNVNPWHNARMTADIDVTSLGEWIPLNNYRGVFDGNGKSIINLRITQTGDYKGFVSTLFGTVRNLTMKNIYINTDGKNVGGIAGYMRSGSRADNCRIDSGTIIATVRIGGIAGTLEQWANISNCCNRANIYDINNGSSMGGILGYAYGGYIENCYNTGEIYGEGTAAGLGGIVGYAGKDILIANCYNLGAVHTQYPITTIGQIAGVLATGGRLENCYWHERSSSVNACYSRQDVFYYDGQLTQNEMKSYDFMITLNNWVMDKNDFIFWSEDQLNQNNGYPVYTFLYGDTTAYKMYFVVNEGEPIYFREFDKDVREYTVELTCADSDAVITLDPYITNFAKVIRSNNANLAEGQMSASVEIRAPNWLTGYYKITFVIGEHSYGDYVSNNDQTCTTDGTKTRTCTICGHKETITDEGSADGVTHTWGAFTFNNDATCTQDGTWSATCTECGESHTETKIGSALGHTHGGPVLIQEQTYFRDGIMETRCTVCNELLERVILPQLIDDIQPEGEITIGVNKWKEFLNGLTFGLLFKETVTVNITGSDSESGLGKTYYYKSSGELGLTELMALTGDDWTEGTGFTVSPTEKFVVYAKITDKAGNLSFLNSQGIIVDDQASTLNVSYSYDGVWTSNGSAVITVNAFDEAGELGVLKSVTYSVNGGVAQIPGDIHSFTIGDLPDGDYDVVITATDLDDLMTTATVRVKMDTVDPGLVLTGNTDNYRTSDTIVITPEAGLSGVAKIELEKQGSGGVLDITDIYQSGYEIDSNGTYRVRLTTGAGKTVMREIIYNKIDPAKPVVSVNTNGYTDGNWAVSDVTLEIVNTTANIGETTLEYAIGEGNYVPYIGAVVVSEDTTGMTYKFRATSAAGVVSDVVPVSVKLDRTAPSGEITLGSSIWNTFLNNITFGLFFKETQTVYVEGSDDTSDIASIEYQVIKNGAVFDPNSGWTEGAELTVTPDNTAVIYAKIVDNAGNAIIINSEGLVVDASAPELDSSYDKDGQWTTDTDAEIAVTAADSADGLDVLDSVSYTIGNGVAIIPADSGSFTIGDLPDGQYQVVITAVNKSGVSAISTISVKKDAVVPSISVSGNTIDYKPSDEITIEVLAGVLNAAVVEVKKDGGSWTDITSVYMDGYRVDANGTYTFRVTNGAGVAAEDTIVYTKIDLAKPVVVLDSHDYTDGSWSTGDVTLEISNSTANLGDTVLEYAVDGGNYSAYTSAIVVSQDTTGTVYSFRATSAAGVVSDVVSITVKVDKTVPSAEITLGENRWNTFFNNITFGLFFKETQVINIDDSDDCSGISSVEYQIVESENAYYPNGEWNTGDTLSIDPESKAIVFAKVTDNAGNTIVVNSIGVVVYTDSAIAEDHAEFDLDPEREGHRDIDVTITLNGNTIRTITFGDELLVEDRDYAINTSGDTVTLKKEYLATIVSGNIELVFNFDPMGETYADEPGNERPSTAVFSIDQLIHAAVPVLTDDLSEEDNASYAKGDAAAVLSVEGGADDDGEISYQWFCNDSEIEGAVSREYAPITDNTGKFVYHCVMTNTNDSVNGDTAASAESGSAVILVSSSQIDPPIIGEGAPQATVLSDSETLLEDTLTEEDRSNLDKGYNISVALKLDLVEGDISGDDKNVVDAALDGFMVGVYLNISIVKTVTDENGNETVTAIDELAHPIRFVIAIPEEYLETGRSFMVIRLHDGVAEVLEDTDDDPATVTIESDCFSVYTLAYKDAAPGTGERGVWLSFVIMLVSLCGVILIFRRKRKPDHSHTV
ncbi:MAG: InlB B-repeat-containing protein [Eubacteriales bacterium]|nr:InlB B-repeat-containing protein [Eubacteriales bacterium]